jgi:hypothetical protein
MNLRTWCARVLTLGAALLFIPACKRSDDDDLTPLAVTFTSPINGAGSVPRQPVVTIRFNRALNPATVIPLNFILVDSLSAIIPAPVSYEACMNEVRLVPSAALDPAATYQVTLMPGITDEQDMRFQGSFFQFIINNSNDVDRPTFSGATTAVNPTQTTINLAWSAGSDLSGNVVYDVFLSGTSGCFDFTVPFITSVSNPTGTTVTGLTANTTYFFVVRARDPFGNVDLNEVEQGGTTLP